MNIIIGGRGTGKTTLLIRDAAVNNKVIVVWDKQRCDAVKKQAKAMKLDIPEPISVQELLSNNYNSKFLGKHPPINNVSIDDGLDILEGIIREKSGGYLKVYNIVINITDEETIWKRSENE